MSELNDRVAIERKQRAEHARKEREKATGWPIRKPTEEEAPVIREFLHNYKGPWQKRYVWAPEGEDRAYPCACIQNSDKKLKRRGYIIKLECVVIRDDSYMDGSFENQYIFLDGRVSGQARHEDLVKQLANLLA